MKIVVVQGDDTLRSRERFVQIINGVKSKGWDVVKITSDGKLTLAEQLVSNSLFPEEVLFVIDGIKRISKEEFVWIGKNANRYGGQLLVYSHGKLPATLKNALPKTVKIENYDVPNLIWSFLDSFYPGNSKKCIELFCKLSKQAPTELIIAMLARQLKEMYSLSQNPSGSDMHAWKASKLKSQAVRFTKDGLVDTINGLSDIDYKSKIGEVNAKHALEFFIIENF